jgi:hypothetical protein
MSRRKADRRTGWLAHLFATFVALSVTATIVALSFGLLAVRFVGLDAYVVEGGPTESMVPIGSLVVVAPVPSGSSGGVAAIDEVDSAASPAPARGTAWVAIPTLGYAVNYAEAYSFPIILGLVVWMLSLLAARALEPYMSTSRRRLPA